MYQLSSALWRTTSNAKNNGQSYISTLAEQAAPLAIASASFYVASKYSSYIAATTLSSIGLYAYPAMKLHDNLYRTFKYSDTNDRFFGHSKFVSDSFYVVSALLLGYYVLSTPASLFTLLNLAVMVTLTDTRTQRFFTNMIPHVKSLKDLDFVLNLLMLVQIYRMKPANIAHHFVTSKLPYAAGVVFSFLSKHVISPIQSLLSTVSKSVQSALSPLSFILYPVSIIYNMIGNGLLLVAAAAKAVVMFPINIVSNLISTIFSFRGNSFNNSNAGLVAGTAFFTTTGLKRVMDHKLYFAVASLAFVLVPEAYLPTLFKVAIGFSAYNLLIKPAVDRASAMFFSTRSTKTTDSQASEDTNVNAVTPTSSNALARQDDHSDRVTVLPEADKASETHEVLEADKVLTEQNETTTANPNAMSS